MPIIKLSVLNTDGREETLDLDDALATRLQETVDADPDLTVAEALRRGIQHVVDNPPTGKKD